ncbi:putative ester cyclase [Streptomyces sp. T12]|uniref:ester cyclase n=1 Tax=Streptomyces sp. T12 TaxID=477697 RepID=UPI0011A077B6|nr:ester cyclase [Streptomyces sp. T12]TWD13537.1 putative ester cyclase [Streptomyces sp. T12]
MTMGNDPGALASAILKVYESGDIARVDDLISPDLIDHNQPLGTASGIDAVRVLVGAVKEGFSDTRIEEIFQGLTTDGWVVSQWRMTGVHTGDWFGTPATGRSVSFTGIDLWRAADGKMVEVRHAEDLLQLQAQLTA